MAWAYRYSHTNNSGIRQTYGSAAFGLGLTFFGISTMAKTMVVLRTYKPFVDLLVTMSNPLLSITFSCIFTALIQSSAASVGLIQVLASQDLITLKAAVCLVLGSNIGTGLTPLLPALNSTREAGRVALANLLFKLIGVAITLPFLELFLLLIGQTSVDLGRQIANSHTAFNLIIALIVFPFSKQIANGIIRLLPDQSGKPPIVHDDFNE